MPAPVPVDRISDTIGRTPVVRLARAAGGADVRVKLETRSPTGSFADRLAREIVAEAKPAKGEVLLDGGDGVLAAALANAVREHGARLHAFVPESSSIEVRQTLAMLGAKVTLTPHAKGNSGALEAARAAGPVARDREGYKAFLRAGEKLAEELRAQIGDDPDARVVVGDETGSVSVFMCAQFRVLQACVKDEHVPHRLAGLPGLVPMPGQAVDWMVVDDQFGWTWRARLAREEGLLLSPAAAAIVGVAIEHAQKHPGSRVYAVASDTGERFFSLKDTFS